MDVGGILRKVELCHVLRQRRGHGGGSVILLARGQLPCLDFFQRGDQRFGTHGADAVKQFTARLLGVNGDRLHHQDVAGVQPFVQLHDGHAGALVTVEHGPLDGRGAAVFRQQRDVQVDAAVLRHMQQLRRDDAAVGHNDDDVGRQLFDKLIGRAVPQRAGLVDRKTVLNSQLLNRRRGQDLLAAHGLVAAGKDTADLVPGVQQGSQAFGGDVRSSHKQDAHKF